MDLDIETLYFDHILATEDDIGTIIDKNEDFITITFPSGHELKEYIVPTFKVVDILVRKDSKKRVSKIVKEAEGIIDASR